MEELWGYGTDQHLGFATLGTVFINEHGCVEYVRGTTGAREAVEQVGEEAVRRLLRLMAAACRPHGAFNPQRYIAAINALQPLGKQAGVAVLREFVKVQCPLFYDEEPFFPLLRAMFEVSAAPIGDEMEDYDYEIVVRPGYFRPPTIIICTDPRDPRKFPLFPLIIVDAIPLLVDFTGGVCMGKPEPAEDHLRRISDAQWRRRPLQPSVDLLQAYETLRENLSKEFGSWPQGEYSIRKQLMRLVDTVSREPPSGNDYDLVPPQQTVVGFEMVVERMRSLQPRWDAEKSCFVRGDGTMLLPAMVPQYRRCVLRPAFAGQDARMLTLIVGRRNPRWVHIDYKLSGGATAATIQVRIKRLIHPETTVVDESIEAPANSLCGSGFYAETPLGEKIEIEARHKDQVFRSGLIETSEVVVMVEQ